MALFLWLSGLCFAQSPGGSAPGPGEKPVTGPTNPVKEVKPDVFYLKDKDGKLQPVLGFTLEDFEQLLLLRAERRQAQQRPAYRLDKFVVTGTAEKEHADLSIQVSVLVTEKSWVRVPLRLGTAVFRKEAKYTGPGEYFIEFDGATQEYVAWFRGESEKPHQLTLQVLAPIGKLAGKTQLKLSVPRAWTSELSLKVKSNRAIGQVSPGAILDSTKHAAGATEFKVLGLAGDFVLSWHDTDNQIATVPTVLEATGAVLARIDGRSIHTEADLTVRSFGGEFDTFRVRLPKGAALVTGDQPDFTLKSLPGKPNGKNGDEAPIVEVQLKNKTVGPFSLRLETQQSHNTAQPDELLSLSGFEVLGAVRQWGHLGVQVVGDWQVAWGERRQVRQIEDPPPELRRADLEAAFEYFGQPYSVSVRVLPRETRLNVEPEYQILVDSQKVHLEAKLKYRVGGAKVFAFELEMPGWVLEEIGPANLVKVDRVVANEQMIFSIPLQQPTTGEVEVLVKAHLEIPAGAKDVAFTLPHPHADSVASAPVVIQAADNVELVPASDRIEGLSRQRGRLAARLPARQQEPLSYRCELPLSKFAATFRVLSRTIVTDVTSQITLEAEGGRVDQRLVYHVAKETTDRLLIDVPYSLAESDQLQIMLDGRPLARMPSGDEEPVPQRPVKMRVDLPEPRIGDVELIATYPLPKDKPAPLASITVQVPLVMPGEGELASNVALVSEGAGVHVQPADPLKHWSRASVDIVRDSPEVRYRFSAKVTVGDIALGVRLVERRGAESTVIERGWIQSWLSNKTQQNRAVYQIASREKQLQLRMPLSASSSDEVPDVKLDGKPVVPIEGATSADWWIPLSPTSIGPRHYRVEVRYRSEEKLPRSRGHIVLLAPVLGPGPEGLFVHRLYWQLVLPPDEHLLIDPPDFTAEYAWTWADFHWGRHPLLEQSELEAWSGASAETPVPAATNRYLFSGIGAGDRLEVRTAGRSWLVLTASGATLVLGLLLIYVPVVRHPVFLLCAAVGILAMSAIYPEPMLLIGQAASLGLFLTALAGWLERSMSRRRRRAGLYRGGASSFVDRESTKTHHPPAPSLPLSTDTAPAVPQFSSPEGPR